MQSHGTSPVGLSISPNTTILDAAATQQFVASITGTGNTGVSWQVEGIPGGNTTVGTISAKGLYVAPQDVSLHNSVQVTAVSLADPTISAYVPVTLRRPQGQVEVSVSPASATVPLHQSEQFTATVRGTSNSAVIWKVNHILGGNASVGTISSTGLFTPPTTLPANPSEIITAVSSAEPTRSTSVPVTIVPVSSVSVSVSPTSATVSAGLSQQFSATVKGSSDTSVTWWVDKAQGGSSTVGTISSAGLYTAPATAPANPSVTLTAVSNVDPTKSASATVKVVSSTSAISVSVAPTPVTVQAGLTRQFTATVTGASNTAVTWSVNKIQGGNSSVGTISATGLFTAPPTVPGAPSENITATSYQDPTKSGTASAVITPPPSTSADYYVAPGGSDSNDGSAAHPWATIANANSHAFAGATVSVAPGTYAQGSNQLNLTTSGTPSAYITYLCSTIRACKITSTITGNNTVIQITGSYIKLVGFDISDTNPSIPNANLGVYINGSNNWLVQNTVHGIQPNCGTAGGGGIVIATNGGNGDVFDGNLIYDIGWANSACNTYNTVHGINMEANAPCTATVTNNIIYHVAGGWGIQSQQASVGTTGSVIANNLLFSNGNGGIVFVDSGGVNDYNTVVNNIIVGNGLKQSKYGFDEYNTSGTHNIYANNDAYGNAGGDYHLSHGSETGGISIDPALGTTFVNYVSEGSGDYHLKAGSPAIDAGTATSAPDHDSDGGARPVNGVFDIGPYEFGSVPSPWPWQ